MADPARYLHELAIELVAMSQNGMTYATDRYDISRYRRLREMSAELLAMIDGAERPDTERFHRALAAEEGHATPKVDVRAALFDERERVLLVQEAKDRRWCLPGGYADALDAPTVAAVREFAEEAGLPVRITRLAMVHDGTLRNGHHRLATGFPWHIYKLMFLCERCDDAEPQAGLDEETLDVGFFALDALPPLSTGRTTPAQLRRLLAHHRDPTLATEVD